MYQENNQEISNLERAVKLRREADFLESCERVKSRLRQLMELSEDPYYDRYLAQMWKDLESGKATPKQVEQEAQRSYLEYIRRMTPIKSALPKRQAPGGHVFSNSYERQSQLPVNIKQPKHKGTRQNTLEFKIGIHVFGMTGALFVLAAFVILG
ncbi:MAG: hypothetical protein HFI97_12140, partial [Lachnospiraceae bacterium]|nr:hypothetical protein [Lachnospiraceae bacterium]